MAQEIVARTTTPNRHCDVFTSPSLTPRSSAAPIGAQSASQIAIGVNRLNRGFTGAVLSKLPCSFGGLASQLLPR